MIKQIILLSGPICSGKTTLCSDFVKEFGFLALKTKDIIRRLDDHTKNGRGEMQDFGDKLDRRTKGEWVRDAIFQLAAEYQKGFTTNYESLDTASETEQRPEYEKDVSIVVDAVDTPELKVSSKKSTLKSADGEKTSQLKVDLSASLTALLGIITELPTRYHPDQLAVSVGSDRIGLAGWIVDRILGSDADLDEESAKLGIADLCERNFVKITATRRLEATKEGARLWYQLKSRGY